MKATDFLAAIPKNQRGPNFTYMYGDCQRIEAENAIRDEEGDQTGQFNDGVVDRIYDRLRVYMTDREFVTQKERQQLAALMQKISYR